jgi:hypothetical protein
VSAQSIYTAEEKTVDTSRGDRPCVFIHSTGSICPEHLISSKILVCKFDAWSQWK